jgi:hypothetical protein
MQANNHLGLYSTSDLDDLSRKGSIWSALSNILFPRLNAPNVIQD